MSGPMSGVGLGVGPHQRDPGERRRARERRDRALVRLGRSSPTAGRGRASRAGRRSPRSSPTRPPPRPPAAAGAATGGVRAAGRRGLGRVDDPVARRRGAGPGATPPATASAARGGADRARRRAARRPPGSSPRPSGTRRRRGRPARGRVARARAGSRRTSGPRPRSTRSPHTVDGVDYPHFHDGIDIAAPVGRPVKAIAAGKVVFAGTYPGRGPGRPGQARRRVDLPLRPPRPRARRQEGRQGGRRPADRRRGHHGAHHRRRTSTSSCSCTARTPTPSASLERGRLPGREGRDDRHVASWARARPDARHAGAARRLRQGRGQDPVRGRDPRRRGPGRHRPAAARLARQGRVRRSTRGPSRGPARMGLVPADAGDGEGDGRGGPLRPGAEPARRARGTSPGTCTSTAAWTSRSPPTRPARAPSPGQAASRTRPRPATTSTGSCTRGPGTRRPPHELARRPGHPGPHDRARRLRPPRAGDRRRTSRTSTRPGYKPARVDFESELAAAAAGRAAGGGVAMNPPTSGPSATLGPARTSEAHLAGLTAGSPMAGADGHVGRLPASPRGAGRRQRRGRRRPDDQPRRDAAQVRRGRADALRQAPAAQGRGVGAMTTTSSISLVAALAPRPGRRLGPEPGARSRAAARPAAGRRPGAADFGSVLADEAGRRRRRAARRARIDPADDPVPRRDGRGRPAAADRHPVAEPAGAPGPGHRRRRPATRRRRAADRATPATADGGPGRRPRARPPSAARGRGHAEPTPAQPPTPAPPPAGRRVPRRRRRAIVAAAVPPPRPGRGGQRGSRPPATATATGRRDGRDARGRRRERPCTATAPAGGTLVTPPASPGRRPGARPPSRGCRRRRRRHGRPRPGHRRAAGRGLPGRHGARCRGGRDRPWPRPGPPPARPSGRPPAAVPDRDRHRRACDLVGTARSRAGPTEAHGPAPAARPAAGPPRRHPRPRPRPVPDGRAGGRGRPGADGGTGAPRGRRRPPSCPADSRRPLGTDGPTGRACPPGPPP